MDTMSAHFYIFLPMYSHRLSAEFVHEPNVSDKCCLQVSGCFRRSWVWSLVSAPSVCTTASVGFIQALWLFPQPEDSNITLNRLCESPTFLVNAVLTCHVMVTWSISAIPLSLLDSNTLRINGMIYVSDKTDS